MTTHSLSLRFCLSCLLAFVALVVFGAPAVRAQSTPKIFVSLHGSDGNVGNSVSPKRTLQAAHDAVDAGGEIVVLDTAGYGALAINKSVSITVPTGVNGFITVPAGTNGVDINAGATDTVTLRGLIIEGADTSTYDAGIFVHNVGVLSVENCSVRSFLYGLDYYSAVSAKILVRGSTFRETAYGICVEPFTSAVADAVITDTAVETAGNSAIFAEADDSATSNVSLTRCTLTHSGNALFTSVANIALDACTVSGNQTGYQNAGGSVQSRGNNTFFNNVSNGSGLTSLGGF